MRIVIAGATGAIGRPLVRRLKEAGHTVFGLERPESARTVTELGAGAIAANATDAAAIRASIARVRPDAVINELTSLPANYSVAAMSAAAERDRKVRVEGNANLLAVLAEAGVRRYILQSSGFYYTPGAGLADESTPFAIEASPAIAAGSRTYAELEAAASQTRGVECVALRYGFFYGPSTWYSREGDVGEQVRKQQVPVIGNGEGVWSWVHIDDAAAATVAALECAPGAYNIVDSDPLPQHVCLPAFARYVGAPEPPHVTEKQALDTFGEDTVYYATRLRGASNDKAKRELQFRPRRLEWL
ncbi:MAG TPA: NAD(P)-dependent oxidoreductase [Patescibacteria group bacterium]|nr:NAD(P)-dependent oxidoreductase [Patescibacteria group bacterium]